MIMTENKALKAAIRERMAETGEPYSVARHAVLAGQPVASAHVPGDQAPGEQIAAEQAPGEQDWDEQ
jgi:hypothetical protein